MKRDIFQNADYRFDFDKAMYINRAAKKAFSVVFIDDHPEEELVRHIGEDTVKDGWTFYFNNPPTDSVKRELERVLE